MPRRQLEQRRRASPAARRCPRGDRRASRSAPGIVASVKSPGSQRVDLVPGERRGHARVRRRPHRIGRGDGAVLGVLVVVDEDAVALLLPPLAASRVVGARRSTSRASASAARRTSSKLQRVSMRTYDVHAARARGLRPADQTEVVERRCTTAPLRGPAATSRPARGRDRRAARRDARGRRRAPDAGAARGRRGSPSTRAPQRSRGTTSSALRPDGKRSSTTSIHVGPRLRRALLVEELAVDAVRVAHQHVGPAAGAAQRALGDREVVAHEVELGVLRLRKQHLAGVRDRDLAAADLQELALRAGSARRLRRRTLWGSWWTARA